MGDYGNFIRTKIYTDPVFPLGICVPDMADVFMFVRYEADPGASSADVDAVAGQLGLFLDTGFDPYTVGMDYSEIDTLATWGIPAGFLQAALTDGTYGFLQVWGLNRIAALTDGSIAQGDRLMRHATTDGGIDTYSDGSGTGLKRLGFALEADTENAMSIGDMMIEMRSK